MTPTALASRRPSGRSRSVVHWNPRVPLLRLGRLVVPGPRRLNNFGDLLGPVIVSRMLERAGLDPAAQPSVGRRLVAVGSILRMARDGDVVWGTGINGKSADRPLDVTSLDVRAVRGPRTAGFLAASGLPSTAVFGDPGLLMGTLWTREELAGEVRPARVTVVQNMNDPVPRGLPAGVRVVHPRSALGRCVGAIAASDLVVGSSLHAVIVAESLGIPARLVRSGAEPDFKYDDYFAGTGRPLTAAGSVHEAIEQGGMPPLEWDRGPLMDAFPYDLWAA